MEILFPESCQDVLLDGTNLKLPGFQFVDAIEKGFKEQVMENSFAHRYRNQNTEESPKMSLLKEP